MLKFFRIPFATSGDKVAVPDPVDVNGSVTYTEGYGFDYERQDTDPAVKYIERTKMNELFFDVTTALRELQSQGVPDFITPTLNGGAAYEYSKKALVKYSGNVYVSLIDANTELPTNTSAWAPALSFTQLGAGAIERAAQSKMREVVSVEDFGAVGDGTTDDTTAIQQALNSVGYGGEVWLSNKRYYVTGLVVPQYVTLRGKWGSPGYDGLAGQAGFDNMRGVLLLDPAGTIAMKQASTLSNLVIFNKTIASGTLPVNGSGSFSGTAVTLGAITGQQSPDMCVENVMILGFNLGISALRCINSKIRHINLDCNNGILADTGGNPIDIQWVLGWPFLSVGYSPYTPAQITRSGYGIRLQNNMDATRIQFCTFFDYTYGFYLYNTNGVTLIACGADAPDIAVANGLHIEGACGITQVVGCQFVANAVGVVVNAANDTDTLLLSDTYFTSNITHDIDIQKGSAHIGGQTFFGSDCPNTVHVVNTTGIVTIGDCAVTKASGTFLLCQNSDNVYLNSGINISNPAVVPFNATTFALPVLASANSMFLPASRSVFSISGTTNIFGFSGGWPGRTVTLYFQGALTLSDAGVGGLNLAGNFTTAAGSTLTLMANTPTSWTEISRSSN